jgi:hypothetical protein
MRVAEQIGSISRKSCSTRILLYIGVLISTVSANPAILSVSRFRGYYLVCHSGDLGVSLSGEGSAAHKTHVAESANFGGHCFRNAVCVCAAPLELFFDASSKVTRDRLSHLRAPLLLARL